MPEMIKPSDVKKDLIGTPWQNTEREIVAMNILKMSHFKNNDQWESFTWDDYVSFCSHEIRWGDTAILEEFAETGYLEKDATGAYHFKNKIIDVYKRYTD